MHVVFEHLDKLVLHLCPVCRPLTGSGIILQSVVLPKEIARFPRSVVQIETRDAHVSSCRDFETGRQPILGVFEDFCSGRPLFIKRDESNSTNADRFSTAVSVKLENSHWSRLLGFHKQRQRGVFFYYVVDRFVD